MKRPHPRIISHEIQHYKTLSILRIIRVPYIEKQGVPSSWIFRAGDGAVPRSRAWAELWLWRCMGWERGSIVWTMRRMDFASSKI